MGENTATETGSSVASPGASFGGKMRWYIFYLKLSTVGRKTHEL